MHSDELIWAGGARLQGVLPHTCALSLLVVNNEGTDECVAFSKGVCFLDSTVLGVTASNASERIPYFSLILWVRLLHTLRHAFCSVCIPISGLFIRLDCLTREDGAMLHPDEEN